MYPRMKKDRNKSCMPRPNDAAAALCGHYGFPIAKFNDWIDSREVSDLSLVQREITPNYSSSVEFRNKKTIMSLHVLPYQNVRNTQLLAFLFFHVRTPVHVHNHAGHFNRIPLCLTTLTQIRILKFQLVWFLRWFIPFHLNTPSINIYFF